MSTASKPGPGANRRDQYMSRQALFHQPTEEEIEAAMQQRIQQGQCRILERATHGLLTWQGDRLVAGPAYRRSVRHRPFIEAKDVATPALAGRR